MNKKSNNYLVIIIVLLLVVAIITGAGLCYLSWSDDYKPGSNGGQMQSTEVKESTEYNMTESCANRRSSGKFRIHRGNHGST